MPISTMKRNYSANFYDDQRGESVRSAERVVSYVTEVLSPKSVLDVGCGAGGWVKEFKRSGAEIAHGIDGPWAVDSGLLISGDDFFVFDFMRAPKPFQVNDLLERYDLLTSFEFVEHLSAEYAAGLVDFFTSKSDAILISGAIPGQGGSHHVNEQWPSYWAELMSARGYQACDFVRPALWDDEAIMPWYRQNIIGYFKGTAPKKVMQRAISEWTKRISQPLNLAHPSLFEGKCSEARPNAGNVRRMTDALARGLIKKAIGRE